MAKVESSVIVGVHLSEIDEQLRPASEMRVALDQEAIQEYADKFDMLPPVKLVWDNQAKVHWLADGCHTVHAAKHLDLSEVKAILINGTYLDAFKIASRANDVHGVRVTNADKRHRVEVALRNPKMLEMSNAFIADICCVSHMTISRLRPESQPEHCSGSKTTGLDGKARSKPKSKRKSKSDTPTPPSNGVPHTELQPEPDLFEAEDTSPPSDPEPDLFDAEDDAPPPDPDPDPSPETKLESEPEAQSAVEPETVSTPAWLERWSRLEKLLDVEYRAWPVNERCLLVSNLLSYGTTKRLQFHPELTDLYNVSLNGKDFHE